MEIFGVLASIVLLVGLIVWLKIHPFLAFLATSIFAGIILNIPLQDIPQAIETGIGSTLSGLVIVICVGAMFGKLVSESGAAQKIAQVLIGAFGPKRITWALMLTGFIVGIPLFYNVGFVLLVPLVFSVVYQSKLPAVYLGIPLLAALSVTHGFLPPHPSPTAMVPMFNAELSTTLIYGLIVAIPTMILAGPVFANALKNIKSTPLATFTPKDLPDNQLPSATNAFATALLPVVLIAGLSFLPSQAATGSQLHNLFTFLANPSLIMLAALAVATYTLGIRQNVKIQTLMERYADAIKDISIIMLIVAGAGALKQVFVLSGVSSDIGALMQNLAINPLLLGWFIATVIRICLGSATVAGLTAAGIMAPVLPLTGADPNLMILAIGAGSLMCSHVNDSGFWMFKEYFNLSVKDTLKSWTLMETIVGIGGITAVLILDVFV
ncbi:GntP family permease [Saccharophagus degradans]|uniref:Gluconate transporter n=1 Tax=Saccharophagus degradans (strain 2-40 / ATCC 43961 / DSM 17024) TaxID=203122 RepID=Q21JH7_SACD2|nr:gluconate:H+ symporter [Saccharophagus degradans]ABD81152.1 gluconate transporter [Saccharophagus degradans 2-40]